jgi:hypothetical protein
MTPQDERDRDRERERDRDRDHDLLVRLDTKLDALSTQFTEARVALALKADVVRVEKLEVSAKEDRATLEEIRRKLYGITSGLAVVQVGLHFFLR